MTTLTDAPTTGTEPPDVLHRLPVLDRYLPVWIGAAMATGLLLGRLVPGLDDALDAVRVGSVSLPIAIGLLAMMYPVPGQGPLQPHRRRDPRPAPARPQPGPQLGDWPGAHVRVGVGVPGRPARVPHRADHRRPGPLHRDGAHLERLGRRRPGSRRRAGRRQQPVPDRRVQPARLLLPRAAPPLARLAHRRARRVAVGDRPHGPRVPGDPAGRRLPDPPRRRRPPRRRLVHNPIPAPHRTGRTVRAARHGGGAYRVAGRQDHQRTPRRGPHRRAATRLLRTDVGVELRSRRAPRAGLPTHCHPRVHRRGQQLRARHRRSHRRVRRQLRPGGDCEPVEVGVG
jgi:hypothetical protein